MIKKDTGECLSFSGGNESYTPIVTIVNRRSSPGSLQAGGKVLQIVCGSAKVVISAETLAEILAWAEQES